MLRRTLALAATALALPAAAAATPATLRVEGPTETLLEERSYDTGTRTVPVGGCAGGTETREIPGATALGILEDARQADGLSYDTDSYAAGPGGVFVCRIGALQTPADFSSFWLYKVNHVLPETTAAGELALQPGDRVLWYFTSDYGARTLDLSAPARAATREAVAAQVASYDNAGQAEPAAGAEVRASGPATVASAAGADGRAQLSFDTPGSYRLEATRAGEVRSNEVPVCVYVPGSGDCGTEPAGADGGQGGGAGQGGGSDTGPPAVDAPPVARIAGIADGARLRRAPRVLSGSVEDDGRLHGVYLRIRMIDRDGCRWLSGSREVLTRPRTCSRARYIRLGNAAQWSYQLPFALPRGARYIVDVKALDASLGRDVEQVRFRVLP